MPLPPVSPLKIRGEKRGVMPVSPLKIRGEKGEL